MQKSLSGFAHRHRQAGSDSRVCGTERLSRGSRRILVREQGVLLLPGTIYDDDAWGFVAGNHFRVGFGRSNFPEALARLEAFLSR